jgi:hypothetical protein
VSGCLAKSDGNTYKLFLVLDGQGNIGQDGRQFDLVFVLEPGFLESGAPLVCKSASCAVLLKHSDLLAGLFDGVQARLKLLLVLLGVFAANKNLDRDLAALERLEIGGWPSTLAVSLPGSGGVILTLLFGGDNLQEVGREDEEGRGEFVA